jgi:hypothetical protein
MAHPILLSAQVNNRNLDAIHVHGLGDGKQIDYLLEGVGQQDIVVRLKKI